MFSEGYIGFTSRTAQNRYSQHKSVAVRANTNTTISNAIRKHGDKLMVTVLCVGNNNYGLWLESVLRPQCGIGWNLAIGGEAPSDGRGPPQAARENMRR